MSLQCQPRFQNFHEFHWRSTSHHIHQPALRMGSQVTRVQNHKPKWNVMMENPNKWYMKYHEISWNIMKYHEISWNIMKYHEISWNIMKYHEISWNIMKYHEISWNIMKYHEISWNICFGCQYTTTHLTICGVPKSWGYPQIIQVDHDLIEINWRRLGIHHDFRNPHITSYYHLNQTQLDTGTFQRSFTRHRVLVEYFQENHLADQDRLFVDVLESFTNLWTRQDLLNLYFVETKVRYELN